MKIDNQGEKSMTILDKIKNKIAEEAADTTGQVADRLQDEAIEAVLGGINSDAWKTYMNNFADSPEQLRRLTAKDATADDPYVRKALAYLVSNAVCGITTITRLKDRLEDGLLDQGL
jgi:hypothetical protein